MRDLINRRSFLGWAATGAAGLLLPGVVRPKAAPVVFDMGRGRIAPGKWYDMIVRPHDGRPVYEMFGRFFAPEGSLVTVPHRALIGACGSLGPDWNGVLLETLEVTAQDGRRFLTVLGRLPQPIPSDCMRIR